MNAYKMEILVTDHEESPEGDVRCLIEDAEFFGVKILSSKKVHIDWSDDNPLNHSETFDAEVKRLFEYV